MDSLSVRHALKWVHVELKEIYRLYFWDYTFCTLWMKWGKEYWAGVWWSGLVLCETWLRLSRCLTPQIIQQCLLIIRSFLSHTATDLWSSFRDVSVWWKAGPSMLARPGTAQCGSVQRALYVETSSVMSVSTKQPTDRLLVRRETNSHHSALTSHQMAALLASPWSRIKAKVIKKTDALHLTNVWTKGWEQARKDVMVESQSLSFYLSDLIKLWLFKSCSN